MRRRRIPGLQGRRTAPTCAKHFFGSYPETAEMVANMTDEDIWRLTRGGHDPQKVYAAYKAAVENKGQPTVMLVKTVKGFGMGKAGEGQNDRAPDQEAGRRGDPRASATASTSRSPDDKLADMPVLSSRRRLAGDEIPARAPQGARRLPAARRREGRRPARRCRRLSTFEALLKPTGRRPRDLHHAWRSCAS